MTNVIAVNVNVHLSISDPAYLGGEDVELLAELGLLGGREVGVQVLDDEGHVPRRRNGIPHPPRRPHQLLQDLDLQRRPARLLLLLLLIRVHPLNLDFC